MRINRNRISFLAPLAVVVLALRTASPVQAGSPASVSPADLQIRAARERIDSGKADARSYNSLAVGLTRKARETGDPSFYGKALEALTGARRQDPENPETARISAWVRMGRHEFKAAYRLARRYDAAHPNDPWNLGVMGDALMELGRYGEAEKAFQAMVDLRPGPASYSRGAYCREIRGDLAGALELMRMALDATAPSEREDRAWLLVQIGHLLEVTGDRAAAESSYRSALASFPDYHYALAALAQVALDSGRPEEAASVARQAIGAAPHAERYLLLADSLRAMRREPEAVAAEDRFEHLALANSEKADNENHDLVLFYLERRSQPARSLALARREAKIRRDVQTLDRLVWSLFWCGKLQKANRLMEKILETGTRDLLVLRHARLIREAQRA